MNNSFKVGMAASFTAVAALGATGNLGKEIIGCSFDTNDGTALVAVSTNKLTDTSYLHTEVGGKSQEVTRIAAKDGDIFFTRSNPQIVESAIKEVSNKCEQARDQGHIVLSLNK